MVRILVVEDEVIVGLALCAELEDLGARVSLHHDAAEALLELPYNEFDAAIIDIGLPGMRGDLFARECRRRFPGMPILLATGIQRSEVRAWFAADSKVEVLEKPHEFAAVRTSLERLGILLPQARPVSWACT